MPEIGPPRRPLEALRHDNREQVPRRLGGGWTGASASSTAASTKGWELHRDQVLEAAAQPRQAARRAARAAPGRGQAAPPALQADLGIVRTLDVGAFTTADGSWVPYLVLEWLEGETLAEHLKARQERGRGAIRWPRPCRAARAGGAGTRGRAQANRPPRRQAAEPVRDPSLWAADAQGARLRHRQGAHGLSDVRQGPSRRPRSARPPRSRPATRTPGAVPEAGRGRAAPGPTSSRSR